jgi:hypothetical protein
MKKYLFILFALMLAFTACKNSSPKEKSVSTEMIMPPPAVEIQAKKAYAPPAIREVEMAEPEGNQIMANKSAGSADVSLAKKENVADTEKKIIKEGEIRFETGNVVETRRQIISSLKKLGGYADDDSEDTNGDAGSKEYTLSIRIPAKNFDAFLGTVSSTATKIDSRNIRVKDVTSQFIDIKTRLDNKKLLESRYLQLLNKATKMSDLLQIEDKLAEIRSDIESTQSQLNYMSKQVAYSSLTITFYTKQAEQVAAGNGFSYKLKSALISGWESLQNLFFGLLSNWYLLLVIALLIVFVKRWRGRRIAKQA